MCFFSVIIPCYNRASQIPRAINSLLGQSCADWELIIVDDGSTDQTRAVVHSFSDPRISYVYQENKERSAARNKGIRLAKGMYICFLDSDDEFLPDHLCVLKKMALLNGNPVAFMHTQPIRIGSRGEQLRNDILVKRPEESMPQLYLRKFIIPDCVCIHRDILREFQFDETLHMAEDSDLFLRIMARFPVIESPEYTILYYQSPENPDPRARLKTYQSYLFSWKKIFNHPELQQQIPAALRQERIFSYYHWKWNACLPVLSLGDLLKDLKDMAGLSPKYLFRAVAWKLILKKAFASESRSEN